MAEAKIVTNTQFVLSSRAQFEDFLKTQTRYKKRKKKETAAGTNSLTRSPVFFSNHTHTHIYNNNNNNKHQN